MRVEKGDGTLNILDYDKNTIEFVEKTFNHMLKSNSHPENICIFNNLSIRICGKTIVEFSKCIFQEIDGEIWNCFELSIYKYNTTCDIQGKQIIETIKIKGDVLIKKRNRRYDILTTNDYIKGKKTIIDFLIQTLAFLSQNMKIVNQEKFMYRESVNTQNHKSKKHKRISVVNIPIQRVVKRYCECNQSHSTHSKCIYSFDVRGHYRHYKSGKTVFIKPFEKNKGKPKKDTIYKIRIGDMK